MPDNHLDDKYIDQAWEQMRHLLDQEMPVQEKRRRGAFWWWLLPLLLLFAGGTGWWLWERQPAQEPQNKELQLNAAPERPVANADTQQPEHEAQSEDETHSLENQVANTESAAISAMQRQPEKATSAKNTSNFIRKNRADKTAAISSTNGIAQDEVPALGDSQVFENKIITSAESTKDEVAAAEPSQQPKPPFTTQSLNIIAPQLLPVPAADLEVVPQLTNRRELFRWGVEGGTLTRTFDNLDGIFGGVIAEFPLRGRVLHLRSGLHYSAYRFDIESQSDIARSESADNPQSGSGFGTNADPNAVSRINFDILAQQIALPVVLVYQPARKWGIELGADFSYLMAATSMTSSEALVTLDSGGNTSFNPDQSTANRFVNSLYGDSNQDIDLNQLNRWGIAASAGVVYYPADKWGVRLHYQYGFTDLLKSTDFQSFDRDLRLSVLYYFR